MTGRRGIPWRIIIVASALTLAPRAPAYELQQTEDGDRVQWYESCFYYTLHEDGAPELEFEQVREAVRESFDVWEDVGCSYFYIEETEPGSCEEVGLNLKKGNSNLLMWRTRSWEVDADHLSSAMALTTVSYNEETGQILDADIEFNAEQFVFGLDGDDRVTDIRNTATHEIGHMLGLDHTTKREATMNPSAILGETSKRTLAQDDKDGLCSLYPLDKDPDSCKLPFCGLDLDCTSKSCDRSCDEHLCATSPHVPEESAACRYIPSEPEPSAIFTAMRALLIPRL